jgi:N utilization substance protein B
VSRHGVPAARLRRREAMMARERGKAKLSRSAARLAAVQATYQVELAGAQVETVRAEFLKHQLAAAAEPELRDADRELFSDLVRGIAERRDDIDRILAGHLTEGWSLDRLELVLAAILRAGAYELVARADVPVRVVINEYVNVAHAFYGGKEPGFVNGVLDRIARELRPEEMDNHDRPPRSRTAG